MRSRQALLRRSPIAAHLRLVASDEGLTVERDDPLDPVNLAFDKSGNLLVLSSLGADGTVYSFRPGTPAAQMTVIAPQDAAAAPRSAGASCPSTIWNNGEFRDQLDLDTMHFNTLAEMFARGRVARPRRSSMCRRTAACSCRPARVFQQGPPDYPRLALLRYSRYARFRQRRRRASAST